MDADTRTDGETADALAPSSEGAATARAPDGEGLSLSVWVGALVLLTIGLELLLSY